MSSGHFELSILPWPRGRSSGTPLQNVWQTPKEHVWLSHRTTDDTDVMVLCLAFSAGISCPLFQKCGTTIGLDTFTSTSYATAWEMVYVIIWLGCTHTPGVTLWVSSQVVGSSEPCPSWYQSIVGNCFARRGSPGNSQRTYSRICKHSHANCTHHPRDHWTLTQPATSFSAHGVGSSSLPSFHHASIFMHAMQNWRWPPWNGCGDLQLPKQCCSCCSSAAVNASSRYVSSWATAWNVQTCASCKHGTINPNKSTLTLWSHRQSLLTLKQRLKWMTRLKERPLTYYRLLLCAPYSMILHYYVLCLPENGDHGDTPEWL